MSWKIEKLKAWFKNKNQRFRESICAPVVFKLMDAIGFKRHLPFTCTGEKAQELIYEHLTSGRPCMVGRIGATEIRNMEGVLHQDCSFWKKIKFFLTLHQTGQSKKMQQLWNNIEEHNDDAFFEKFTQIMLKDIEELDVFASWRWEENEVMKSYNGDVISLGDLEPFFSSAPWTRALAGKKVLVIHPFHKTVEFQYSHRKHLFENPDILPEFELITYQPFFWGVRDNPDKTKDFMRNLESMKKEIEVMDFDVALIAAGTYGFPLAAHIKRMGRQAVVMGGVLQILFGIKGARWDAMSQYNRFYNEYWLRPGEEYKPKCYSSFDGGCYW